MRMLFPKICQILFTCFLSTSLYAAGADTITIEGKLMHMHQPVTRFTEQIWQNPAIRYHWLPFSITMVDVNGGYGERGDAALVQEGNGKKGFGIDVTSFVVFDERQRLFGTASYRNGRRENVQWNENADFELIYPYVVGDSIGGFMKEEEYKFSGGYAYHFRKWTLAAEFDYRATIAYRDMDPRPRNVVSDLEAGVAMSRILSNYSVLGISFHARKYNQQSSISFLADKGSTSVYQMLGMGMNYVRFAGTQTSTRYTGAGVGGSIDLLPAKRGKGFLSGFSASLHADYFHLTKQLPNANYAPINEVADVDVSLETSWTKQSRSWEYGVKLLTEMSQRTGTENIFGDPTSGIYPQISSQDQFQNRVLRAGLTGMVGQQICGERHWSWVLMPYAAYSSIKPEYKGASRRVEISAMQTGLRAQANWKFSKWLLAGGADGGYTNNLKLANSLPGLDVNSSAGKALLANIRYLGDDHISFAFSLRGNYVMSARYALFLSGRWVHQFYKISGETNLAEVSVGFVF